MNKSRTVLSIKNISSAGINKIINYLVKFVLRTIFIMTLPREYLGVDSLFSSILLILSLADLGFDIALPSRLYGPLNEGDNNKIIALMEFYKKVYVYVGVGISVLGILLYPVAMYSVPKDLGIPYLKLIYLLYVVQTVVSYLFVYKKTLLIADQKNYVVTNTITIVQIVLAILQICILLITKSFLLYLICSIIAILVQNSIISVKCDQIFPFIKNRKNYLAEKEKKALFKDVIALFFFRISTVAEVSIAAILVNMLMGISYLGTLSNYILIIQSLSGLLMIVFSSITPSIGNLIVSESNEKVFEIYRKLNFAANCIYGAVTVMIFVLIKEFVSSCWLNSSYALPDSVVFAMLLPFYVAGTQNMNSSFRNAYGLFWQARYRPIIMTLTLIVFSYALGKTFGVCGIYLGITLSRIVSVGVIDPYIVFKYGLNKSVFIYHKDYFSGFAAMLMTTTICMWLMSNFSAKGIASWIIKASSTFICTCLLYYVVYHNDKRYKYWQEKIKKVFN